VPQFLSGHVVDFFSPFDPHGRTFAIFNVADMALTFGVILAVSPELLGRRRDGTRAPRRGSRTEARDRGRQALLAGTGWAGRHAPD
jgi:signal peptidase II